MEFNLNNLATVDTTDILQEAVQLSLGDSDVTEVSFVDNAGNLITNPEGDIVFELIDEQAGGKPFEVDILDQIKLKDEPIENTPQVLGGQDNNTMPNLQAPFGSQMPSNQPQHLQQQNMGYNHITNDGGNGQYMNDMKSAYVTILEQPSANKHRFRYECEGRAAGSLPGKNSAPDNKKFPTIKVMNYQGPAVVVVSCVEDKPNHKNGYRAHPHNLVGKNSKKGVFSKEIDSETMTATFQNLGVQCVTRKNAENSIKIREQNKVDPFKCGFDYANLNSFNLNAVRLCFQVFLRTGTGPKDLFALEPVVSDIIYDAKAYKELTIVNVSDNCAPVEGGKKLLLFCERVSRDDIEIRFRYQDRNGQYNTIKGHFSPNDVHHQLGIAFTTPVFPDQSISESVETQMFLHKPSDGCESPPVTFYFTPKEFAVPTKKLQAKRTKAAIKLEEQNDSELSERMKLIPPKNAAASGGFFKIKSEENDVKEEDKMSNVEKLLKDTECLKPLINNPNRPVTQDELGKLLQSESGLSGLLNLSDKIPSDIDVLAQAHADPNNMQIDLLENISGQLSGMDISEKDSRRVTRSRTKATENSCLETPEVSMEQSKPSSGSRQVNKLNNLNKL